MRAGETKPPGPDLHRRRNRTSTQAMSNGTVKRSWLTRILAGVLMLAPALAGHALEPENQVDLGDGTIADVATGLQWEKKVAADAAANPAQPHDVDNRYTATEAAAWLASLNESSFAGQADWRLPTRAELVVAMPAARHPLRSERTSMFHQWPCRQACADLADSRCSCVAVATDAHYRTATRSDDGESVALGYVPEQPGLDARYVTDDEALPARAVRTLLAGDLVRVRHLLAARPTPLPNEIYAGVAPPRTEKEVLLCKQGCSNRFLKDQRGDVLVRCLERCRSSDAAIP